MLGGFDLETKKELRKNIIHTLRQINENTFIKWSDLIAEQITSLPEWKSAKTIGITIAGAHEINTEKIIRFAWDEKKNVVVPKCNPLTKAMDFRRITSFSQLEVVYFGIKEPIEHQTEKFEPEEIDLLIVPGLCFTKEGYRLGHGGGYYDRYLTTYDGQTISLAFPVQIVNSLPIEHFDIPVKKLITTDGVILCHA